MTAEEVALNSFRNAVERARMHREAHAIAERNGNPTEQYAHWRLSRTARDTASDIANIIRAIRAEREERGYLVDAFGQGIRTAYETGRRAGRRDALRGVQWACLFEMGRLEEKPREYGGASWDWEGYPEDMHAYDALWEVVEAAEEAAR